MCLWAVWYTGSFLKTFRCDKVFKCCFAIVWPKTGHDLLLHNNNKACAQTSLEARMASKFGFKRSELD